MLLMNMSVMPPENRDENNMICVLLRWVPVHSETREQAIPVGSDILHKARRDG